MCYIQPLSVCCSKFADNKGHWESTLVDSLTCNFALRIYLRLKTSACVCAYFPGYPDFSDHLFSRDEVCIFNQYTISARLYLAFLFSTLPLSYLLSRRDVVYSHRLPLLRHLSPTRPISAQESFVKWITSLTNNYKPYMTRCWIHRDQFVDYYR